MFGEQSGLDLGARRPANEPVHPIRQGFKCTCPKACDYSRTPTADLYYSTYISGGTTIPAQKCASRDGVERRMFHVTLTDVCHKTRKRISIEPAALHETSDCATRLHGR